MLRKYDTDNFIFVINGLLPNMVQFDETTKRIGPIIDPEVPSKINTRWNRTVFICLLIFWACGLLIGFTMPIQSYAKYTEPEKKKFPETQKLKQTRHYSSNEVNLN